MVIFDCDGVLVDSEPLAARALADYLTELGVPHGREDCFARYTGLSIASVKTKVEADFACRLPDDFAERLRERDREVFARELRAMPGIAEAIAALPGRRCVASSGIPEKIRHSLAVTGLLALFEPHLFSASMVARGKPAPDLFQYAAGRMDVAPADCLVVEDSLAGVAAGRAAGMRVFGFTGGGHCGPGHGEALRAAGAELVFERMADLPALASRHPNRG